MQEVVRVYSECNDDWQRKRQVLSGRDIPYSRDKSRNANDRLTFLFRVEIKGHFTLCTARTWAFFPWPMGKAI